MIIKNIYLDSKEYPEFLKMFIDLYNEVRENYLDSILTNKEALEMIGRKLKSSSGYECLEFIANKKVVGFVTLWRIRDELFIDHFCVLKPYRHKGIGTAMVDELINRYGSTNYFWYVIKNNKPAMEFWKEIYKLKFNPTMANPITTTEEEEKKTCIKFVGVPRYA